jgi:signal transduction histidine kinase
MGLPIARAIVETHGGTMRVVSRVGQGSVFTFSLPLDRDQSW